MDFAETVATDMIRSSGGIAKIRRECPMADLPVQVRRSQESIAKLRAPETDPSGYQKDCRASQQAQP
jgi:hypothetical protein